LRYRPGFPADRTRGDRLYTGPNARLGDRPRSYRRTRHGSPGAGRASPEEDPADPPFMRSRRLIRALAATVAAAALLPAPTATAHGDRPVVATPPITSETLSDLEDKLGPGFRTYRAKGFAVLSDADASWVRARLGLLTRTRHEYERFFRSLDVPLSAPPEELRCVIFAEHADYRRFAQRVDKTVPPWAGGYYTPLANRVVLFNEETSPVLLDMLDELREQEALVEQAERDQLEAARGGDRERAERIEGWLDTASATVRANAEKMREQVHAISAAKLVHETVHLLAYNTGVQSANRLDPIWFTEGLATSFETDGSAGAFGPKLRYLPREEFVDRLKEEGALLDPAALVGLHVVPDEAVEPLYAQSYALFTYLARRKSDELAAFIRDLRGREGVVEDGLGLFREHFGEPRTISRAAGLR